MSDYRIVGLEKVEYGTVTAGYTMPSVTEIDHIVPESAKLIFETPEPTRFYTENSDDVDVEIAGRAAKSVEFATVDMGFDTIVLAFGGSTSGTAWSAPTTATLTTQKALRLTTKEYNGTQYEIDIPNAALRAGGELQFSKNAVGQIAFAASVLKCGDTTSPMIIRQI